MHTFNINNNAGPEYFFVMRRNMCEEKQTV